MCVYMESVLSKSKKKICHIEIIHCGAKVLKWK